MTVFPLISLNREQLSSEQVVDTAIPLKIREDEPQMQSKQRDSSTPVQRDMQRKAWWSPVYE